VDRNAEAIKSSTWSIVAPFTGAWIETALGSKPNQSLDSEGQIMIRAGQDPVGGDDGESVLAL
jgi:hypothetical protein